MSNAARERAKIAKAQETLPERDSYTAKQAAARCGTEPKTFRKFLRSAASSFDPVGQGGRYEFDTEELEVIKGEFHTWRKKVAARRAQQMEKPSVPITEVMDKAKELYLEKKEMSMDDLADAIEHAQDEEPSEEDLMAIESDPIDDHWRDIMED